MNENVENEKAITDHINFVIDKELKTEFKITLLRQDKNISEVLSGLVEEYVKKYQDGESI
jgi:hypothetical protein